MEGVGVLFSLDKLFLELRFEPSLLFQDYVGTIAHSIRSVFPDVEQGFPEIVAHEGVREDPRIRIGPGLAWFSPSEGTSLEDFLLWVKPVAERVVSEIMAVGEVTRIGLRGYSLLALPTVEDGVNLFRGAICDHYTRPLSVLPGEPSGVRLELRLAGWETVDGLVFDLVTYIAPIKLPESVVSRLPADRSSSSEWEGGLLLDLDAGLAEGQALSLASALEVAASLATSLSVTVNTLLEAMPKEQSELHERAEGS